MTPTSRALERFGLGARPGEAVPVGDARGWLEAQLEEPPPLLSGASLPSPSDVGEAIGALRQARGARNEDTLREARERIRRTHVAEMHASLGERLTSERPFVERLVAFWSNHLCVSAATKVAVAPLAGLYERQVIRPHVLGRFEDMVLASARHPGMLLYLDNAQSMGPDSPAARLLRRRGGERGLNENYARELMELHTLGVDGGYTQDDVVEMARTLTGWTIGGLGAGGPAQARMARRRGQQAPSEGSFGFAFIPALHEPGARTILGRRYSEAGEEQGVAVIRSLCRHPSTARFLATKLVRHFVSDDPPARAVDLVAGVFADTGGDLREVARSLVALDEAWDPAHLKIRTPQDWTVAALRALGVGEAPPAMPPMLTQLRQPLWGPPSPKGWGDTVREWADPDALMNRAELARTLAGRVGRRRDPTALARLLDAPPDDPVWAVTQDESVPRTDRLALVLAGPSFQWR